MTEVRRNKLKMKNKFKPELKIKSDDIYTTKKQEVVHITQTVYKYNFLYNFFI